MTRPIPTSYYYSGQGRLMIGQRNATTGAGENMIPCGNVTSLTIDLAVTKFEHKESMSGVRSIDATIITEQKASVKFTTESLSLDNLVVGLYGTKSTTSSTAVTAEAHPLYVLGTVIPLKKPKVTSVVVKVGATTAVLGVDYNLDADFGTVYPISTSTLIVAGVTVLVDYTSGVHDVLDALTTGSPPERFIRFEGLNSYNGDLVLLNMPRVSLDPMTGLEYINDNFGKADLSGNILLDSLITVGSQYFTQRRITPA